MATDGSVYVAGQANPGDMPTTPGAATTPDVAFRDAFVMRVNAAGTASLFVARFGGADNDRATSLVVEPDGNVLVAGKWLDKGGIWHGPRGGFQTSIARQWAWSNTCEATVPTEAAFLLRVAPNGSQVGGASLIGAVGGDLAGWMGHEGVMPVRIAPDGAGHVLIVGTTDSGQSLPTRLPFVPDAELYQYAVRPTHAFVMKVRTADFALVHASRFGPRNSHAEGRGVAADGDGNVFVAGHAPKRRRVPDDQRADRRTAIPLLVRVRDASSRDAARSLPECLARATPRGHSRTALGNAGRSKPRGQHRLPQPRNARRQRAAGRRRRAALGRVSGRHPPAQCHRSRWRAVARQQHGPHDAGRHADECIPMTACARGTTWVVGLAAGLLSLLAHASFVWQVDGQVPMRIDIATATTQSAAEPGPVDAIVPLPDGGAWLRRGSELIRLTPDLRVAARASVALAGPMHWEPQSRRLWVLAGRDLLRYDEHLLLEGAVRFDVELRGLAGSGPDAIWVATDTRLMRFQRDGEQVDAVELSSMALGGTVAGVLADTPRARVWVVATSGEMVAIDVADGLRPAGIAPGAVAGRAGRDRRRGQRGDPSVRPGNLALRARWRGPRSDAGRPCPGGSAVDRRTAFRGGVASFDTMPAIAVPIVVLDAHTHLRSHWMPPDAVAVTAGPPVVRSTLDGIRVAMALNARCGAVGCAGADPLMETMRAEVQLAGHVREGVMHQARRPLARRGGVRRRGRRRGAPAGRVARRRVRKSQSSR